jgi:murein DD-endopeptidase MepM/ murein hydrolase activator NlpD
MLLALQGLGHANNNQPPPDLLAPLHVTATLTWGTVCTAVADLSVLSNPAYFVSVAGIVLPSSSFSDTAREFAGFDTVTIRCGGCGNAVANIGCAVTVNGNALTVPLGEVANAFSFIRQVGSDDGNDVSITLTAARPVTVADILNVLGQLQFSAQVYGNCAGAPPQPQGPPTGLSWPIGCAPGIDCTISNYPSVCAGAGSGHEGTDIVVSVAQMDAGVPIYAAAGGRVFFASDGKFDRCGLPEGAGNPDCVIPTGTDVCTRTGPYCGTGFGSCFYCFGGGNVVVLLHDGVPGVFATRYDHFRTNSITVKEGDVVTRGQLLGYVGSAGRSTAPHLHFEVWGPAGYYQPVNPWPTGDCPHALWAYNPPWVVPAPCAAVAPGALCTPATAGVAPSTGQFTPPGAVVILGAQFSNSQSGQTSGPFVLELSLPALNGALAGSPSVGSTPAPGGGGNSSQTTVPFSAGSTMVSYVASAVAAAAAAVGVALLG